MPDEIAVIGGGIVGANIGYHLSRKTDRPITVYEKNQSLVSETTAKSIASWSFKPTQTNDDANPPDVTENELFQMKQYGMEFYNKLLSQPRTDSWYELIGELSVATTKEGAEILASDAATQDGLPATSTGEYLSREELRQKIVCPELDTESIEGALYHPYIGVFAPENLAMEVVKRAKEHGVTFELGAPVTDIRVENDRVTGIAVDGKHIETSATICASGGWNAGLARCAGIDIPVQYTAGYTMEVNPQPRLCHTLPKLDHHESPVGFCGHKGDTSLIYQTGPSANFDEFYDQAKDHDPSAFDDELPSSVHERFRNEAELLVPALAKGETVVEHATLLSRTPDAQPIVGWTELQGFSIAALHAAGIQLAPAIGHIIATQLVDGDPTAFHDYVSISRFKDYDETPYALTESDETR